MKSILVTGSSGFVGTNLVVALNRMPEIKALHFDVSDSVDTLNAHLDVADIVFHLAGVNRPERNEEFETGNVDFTSQIVDRLQKRTTKPLLVMSSSIQAELDNPYGRSKLKAEGAVEKYGNGGGRAVIFRLPNIFGKWSRPNYNSAVATFCYNIARGLDIKVSDPERVVELVYIDDVISAFVHLLDESAESGTQRRGVTPTKKITLQQLTDSLYEFRNIRTKLLLPDLNDRFLKSLYATYLSFLLTDDLAYALVKHEDERGCLAELLKSPHFGQVFISRTKPGYVRGNHYHNTKVEKFCVIEGNARISFRNVLANEVIDYEIEGSRFEVVDIPPGLTHSIENVGSTELIVLFWASEIFDPQTPDSYFSPVHKH